MVDGTTAGNSDIRAGPLLGDTDEVTIHAYVDHSIIAVIFNNRTSLTVSVKPSAEDSTGVATIGAGVTATVHKLNAANQVCKCKLRPFSISFYRKAPYSSAWLG